MVREKTIENRIKKHLDSIGAYYIKYHGNAMSRAGVPDILVCIKGHFLGIEVKQENGRVSPLQTAHLELIRRAGGTAFVVWSYEEYLLRMKEAGYL